tara:strand:- start:8532 stop:9137 length:606 start_codon:yes stop_codon:yes gene_type:complete
MFSFDFDIKSAKSHFFDVQAIKARTAPESQRILSEYGRDVRQTDRKSIRPRKQMTLAEMSTEQRAAHKRRQRIAKQAGRPAPKKPTKGSEPGQAPRRGASDLLRKHTYYIYDRTRDSVVVGAAKLGGVKGADAPETLEHGGYANITWGENRGRQKYVAPRPHITPAYQKHLPQLPGRFRGRFGGSESISSPSGTFTQPSLF